MKGSRNMAKGDFVAFILTHGRADNVLTYQTLRRSGYTGRIVLVIDDEDESADEYRKRYGRDVVQFSKDEVVKRFDIGDNFTGKRGVIIYARNACFDIAREIGAKYFIELDDDYTQFTFRFNNGGEFKEKGIKNLDKIFALMVDYFVSLGPRCKTLAMAQGGDFIGGKNGAFGEKIFLSRKAMNSFMCCIERPFDFVGRINEDVNTYTSRTYRGDLFLTINSVCLHQKQTQGNKGGMTDVYIDNGTYLKSFYSVMYHPSGVKVAMMGDKHKRLHHRIDWNATAPKIVRVSNEP